MINVDYTTVFVTIAALIILGIIPFTFRHHHECGLFNFRLVLGPIGQLHRTWSWVLNYVDDSYGIPVQHIREPHHQRRRRNRRSHKSKKEKRLLKQEQDEDQDIQEVEQQLIPTATQQLDGIKQESGWGRFTPNPAWDEQHLEQPQDNNPDDEVEEIKEEEQEVHIPSSPVAPQALPAPQQITTSSPHQAAGYIPPTPPNSVLDHRISPPHNQNLNNWGNWPARSHTGWTMSNPATRNPTPHPASSRTVKKPLIFPPTDFSKPFEVPRQPCPRPTPIPKPITDRFTFPAHEVTNIAQMTCEPPWNMEPQGTDPDTVWSWCASHACWERFMTGTEHDSAAVPLNAVPLHHLTHFMERIHDLRYSHLMYAKLNDYWQMYGLLLPRIRMIERGDQTGLLSTKSSDSKIESPAFETPDQLLKFYDALVKICKDTIAIKRFGIFQFTPYIPFSNPLRIRQYIDDQVSEVIQHGQDHQEQQQPSPSPSYHPSLPDLVQDEEEGSTIASGRPWTPQEGIPLATMGPSQTSN